jgi:hypothetical protein
MSKHENQWSVRTEQHYQTEILKNTLKIYVKYFVKSPPRSYFSGLTVEEFQNVRLATAVCSID